MANENNSKYLLWAGTAITAIYLLAMVVFCLTMTVELWPYPTPAGVVKVDPGTQPPKTDTAKTDTSKTDTAKTDTSKTNTSKTDTAKTDTSKTDTAKTDTSKTDTAKTDTSKTDTSKTGTTKTDTVKTDTSKTDTSKTDTMTSAWPTDQQIAFRQKRLCSEIDSECNSCIQREMQLQAESKRVNDPQCIRVLGCHVIMWQEERLLLLVLLTGAIGALLSRLLSFFYFIGVGKFTAGWLPYYYLAPFAGASLGCVMYLVIRGGFFSSNTTTSDTNPFMFLAVSALAGLFTRQVMAKLKTIAESMFEKAPEGTRLAIQSLTPSKVPVHYAGPLTLTGTGFAAGSTVKISATSVPVTFKSDKELDVATIPGTLT
ncbi:MAG: hypothetical protein JWN02_2656, partial [Acidobacteria bacterium]|nr:hypothetical protein [Acidobacteriota bacterium]